MKKITKILAAMLLVTALIYSCKKKEDPAPAATTTSGTTTSGTTSGTTTSTGPTKTELITDKNWGMTAGIISPGIKGENPFTKEPVIITDLYKIEDPFVAAVAECVKDDILMLKAGDKNAGLGTYTRLVKVACKDEKDDSGTWKFNTAQTQVIFTSSTGEVTTNKILLLTSEILKIEATLLNPFDSKDTQIYTATITLSPK